jgi:hypothetical protein
MTHRIFAVAVIVVILAVLVGTGFCEHGARGGAAAQCGKPTVVDGGGRANTAWIYATNTTTYVVYCEARKTPKDRAPAMLTVRQGSTGAWAVPRKISDRDCEEIGLSGVDENHLIAAISGYRRTPDGPCAPGDDAGCLDVWFVESLDGGAHWQESQLAHESGDAVHRRAPKVVSAAGVVWVAAIKGSQPRRNITYWYRLGSSFTSEQTDEDNQLDELGFSIAASVTRDCGAVFIAKIASDDGDFQYRITRHQTCSGGGGGGRKRSESARVEVTDVDFWKADHPVQPAVIAVGSFVAVVLTDAQWRTTAKQYVGNKEWRDVGILIAAPSPAHPAVAVQPSQELLAIVLPTNTTPPCSLNAWQVSSGWEKVQSMGISSGGVAFPRHPHVSFLGSNVVAIVFTDEKGQIWYNNCS